MKHPRTLKLATVLALAAGVIIVPPPAHAGSPTIHAKITMRDARAIALKAYPGVIVKEELEREHGGSGLRYSFDLRNGKAWREVGVDAMTGKILENAKEGANPKD